VQREMVCLSAGADKVWLPSMASHIGSGLTSCREMMNHVILPTGTLMCASAGDGRSPFGGHTLWN
jgi:hypothetical protein